MSEPTPSGICMSTLDQLLGALNRSQTKYVKLTDDPKTKEQITGALNGVVASGPSGPEREKQIIEIFKTFFPVSWELEQKQEAEKLEQEEKTRENVARRKAGKARRAIERAEAEAKAKAEAKAEAGINPEVAPISEPTQ